MALQLIKSLNDQHLTLQMLYLKQNLFEMIKTDSNILFHPIKFQKITLNKTCFKHYRTTYRLSFQIILRMQQILINLRYS